MDPVVLMRTADFHYDLPPDRIAQRPAEQRADSRLMVLNRTDRSIAHSRFESFPSLLRSGDVLVLNNSKVIPARLRAVKKEGGGRVEMLLVEERGLNDWWVMLRPGRRVRVGTILSLVNGSGEPSTISAQVKAKNDEGHCRVQFDGTPDIAGDLDRLGEVPLPPYIERLPSEVYGEDLSRYQTVYAGPKGSVAAPTAGLHFTTDMMTHIQERGVAIAFVTLHVGLGTFAPVKADHLADIHLHRERFEYPAATAELVQEARRDGRRVIAVGTTTARVLEGAAAIAPAGQAPEAGTTDVFIHPPYRFRVVDGLLTNFHLPQSTLLMLVSAFAAPGNQDGVGWMLKAYHEAVQRHYRFFSYGDAMFIHDSISS